VPQHGNSVMLSSEETRELLVEGDNSTWETCVFMCVCVCVCPLRGEFQCHWWKNYAVIRMKIIAGCCITKDCASVFQSHEVLDSKVCASQRASWFLENYTNTEAYHRLPWKFHSLPTAYN
jgi:hypothetical protein